MKRAIMLLGLIIFFSSRGMENVIKSIVLIAPPYVISEPLQDNYQEEREFIKSIWYVCKRYKDWLISYMPSCNTTQADAAQPQQPVSSISDAFSELQ